MWKYDIIIYIIIVVTHLVQQMATHNKKLGYVTVGIDWPWTDFDKLYKIN